MVAGKYQVPQQKLAYIMLCTRRGREKSISHIIKHISCHCYARRAHFFDVFHYRWHLQSRIWIYNFNGIRSSILCTDTPYRYLRRDLLFIDKRHPSSSTQNAATKPDYGFFASKSRTAGIFCFFVSPHLYGLRWLGSVIWSLDLNIVPLYTHIYIEPRSIHFVWIYR